MHIKCHLHPVLHIDQVKLWCTPSLPSGVSTRGRPLPRRTSRPPLLALLCADALAAIAASALVAPIVTIMDKAVTLSAAGQMGLGAAVRRNARALVATPRAFLTSPEYAWIFSLYATTYAPANTISTCCDHSGRDHTVT